MTVYRPKRGQLVHDRRTNRTGVYMGAWGGQQYVRPEGGGCEWTADPADVGPIGPGLEYANPLGAPRGSIRLTDA
ncbi:hypothetical protein AB0D10_18245 [Kitasatospora sp. NPDC048545]|uniref:hypothetical protein n=1 Tax=Kitasatospora sp. NPDC048545 TaxID=3157208 RepID=UPI0033D594FB